MRGKIPADKPRHASRSRGPFFTKLRIGAPGDRFEREADRVADQVASTGSAPEVQRMCAGCVEEEGGGEIRRQALEEEEDEEVVQARPDPSAARAAISATSRFTPGARPSS